MNELKSYTEYAVSTPTSDFVIGFDFNYGEDAVNVTVDNVPAQEAGYTVVYLDESTIQLSPSVPSGVVRLQRETDIDQSDHAYRAGAKFIAQTMDENFEQLRHSQQEVRDGFYKLSDDTYAIIDTLEDVAQSAQDAADDANAAAQVANDAAAQVADKVSQSELSSALQPITQDLTTVKRYTPLPYITGKNYGVGERVTLSTGEIVENLVPNNNVDPNTDMLGWRKGVDASDVKDESGLSQQEINNGLESIAELRTFNPKKKGVRIYVKSYYSGLEKGGGVFVSTQKSGLVDNGVTVFSSPDPLYFWVRIGYDKIIASMAGAKGQRDTDDQPAIQNALSVVDTVYLDYPVAGYRFDSPLLIAREKSLEGLGRNQVRINVNHDGIAIDITGQNAAVRNITTFSYDNTESGRYKYTGIRIGSSSQNSTIGTTIDNVSIGTPKIGIVTNKAFWSNINGLAIFRFRDYGILLDNNSNNNIINFKQIASNVAQLPTGYFDFDSVTWEQAAIKVIGNQNKITGGEPAPSKYGVIINENSTGNVFNNLYTEHQLAALVTGANSETFWNGSCALSQAQIHPDSVVYGMDGKRFGVNMNLPTKPFAAQYKLNALWLFNEGFGTKIADRSGNGRHLTAIGSSWVDTGRWGATLNINAERTSYISPAPTTIVDITQPFHVVACVKFNGDTARPIIKIQTAGPKYLLLQANNTFASVLDYDGSNVEYVSCSSAFKALSDGYQWLSYYFDPISKTVTCIDPVIGTHSSVNPTKPCRFSITAPVALIDIGNHSGKALDGSISFLGVWQRKLTLQEVTALVNTEDPRVFANTKIESQADSSATDIDTLKADYNSLLAKLRKAGIML